MYNIITERNLREALESIPAQYTVDMEKIKQVRYSTGRGMYICKMLAENLSLIMEGEPESFRGGDIAFSTARRVMEMLGWKCSYAGKATLGQDAYYCIICTKPDKDFKYKIFGNAYEGSISISKEKL